MAGNSKVVLLTIPGLRADDIPRMPNIQSLVDPGTSARIVHSFPAVTWPSQTNLLTGCTNREHGIVANGIYDRAKRDVEMWTSWNEVIEQPQIWDQIRTRQIDATTAAWFPMLSKGCNADFVCMPAPIHHPDGSEDLWCHTKPQEFYGELLNQMGHFPLQHFWGPLANIKSSQWIADSAIQLAQRSAPDFFYIYLPHLDYAAQKDGPDSEPALAAVIDLDNLIGEFAGQLPAAYESACWMIVSEYVITAVDHVSYPNRTLREQGLLSVAEASDGSENLDFANSKAWAMVDHQFSHVFVKDRDAATIESVCQLFKQAAGINHVVAGAERDRWDMSHERCGDVILISSSNSWQAYYWWLEDQRAPGFARTVDIHRKPGYDPVELHFDFQTKSVPLDATLIRGSHGAPVTSDHQKGVFLTNKRSATCADEISEREIFQFVMDQFNS